MNTSLGKDKTSREKLLVMAAYLHGANPRNVRANCGRVLRQALYWAGFPKSDQREIENSIIEEWYRTLISMTKNTPDCERLLEGFGNLGTEKDPPALWTYTACCLTPVGREIAKRLFDEHPEYKGAKGKLQRNGRKSAPPLKPYCLVVELYRATDGCCNRESSSFEELRDFLAACYRNLSQELRDLRAKYPQEWKQTEDCRDDGFSAILQNQWNDLIQIGVSKDFWSLSKVHPFERLTSDTNVNEQGKVAFYFPERTEYDASQLHSSADGAKLLKKWLDTGVLFRRRPSNRNDDANIVYVMRTGKKYHGSECGSLNNCITKRPIKLERAKQLRYEACTRCKPPR